MYSSNCCDVKCMNHQSSLHLRWGQVTTITTSLFAVEGIKRVLTDHYFSDSRLGIYVVTMYKQGQGKVFYYGTLNTIRVS